MKKFLIAFSLALTGMGMAIADNVKDVHGQYTYYVPENDDITLKDAKHKVIELAKADAIKKAFGEYITSDIISGMSENGEDSLSYFWENTVAMAKGDWLSDTHEPKISVEWIDNMLVFNAEVWGKAREKKQSNIDLQWEIQKDINGRKIAATDFENGERILVTLKSPAEGYVAVYLIEGDDQTSCLLPYPKDASGKVRIKNGKEYTFFDKTVDPLAVNYRMKTEMPLEHNEVVIIYSPNPFAKCNDITGDARHPNSLSTADFQKWLLKCQRNDAEMVVNKKWIRIHNKS